MTEHGDGDLWVSEGVFFQGVALAYDMVRDSGLLTIEDRVTGTPHELVYDLYSDPEDAVVINRGDKRDLLYGVPELPDVVSEKMTRSADADHLGAVNGELIGTCRIPPSVDPQEWIPKTISLPEPRGKRDLNFVFKGGAGSLMDVDSSRGFGTFPGRKVSNGLVGHWRFDEGSGAIANDVSGLGHDGSIANAAWVDGVRGKALDFNGSTSTVSIPSNAFYGVSMAITGAMWVYGDDRINKTASASDLKGLWAHWVFTKNTKTGTMCIYRSRDRSLTTNRIAS